MRKKSAYAWSLVAALMMTACSSDQNEEADNVSAKTGTFEIGIKFADSDNGTRASTFIPTTSWDNIKQIQFFLYNSAGNVAWSAIETPSSGTTVSAGRQYVYATVPADTYTLVAVANAKSSSDAVATFVGTAAMEWTVANVYNRAVADLAIKHKAGSWNAAITGSALTALAALTPHTAPSEVFMGYKTNVIVSSTATANATVDLTREVAMMRVRLDQASNAPAASNVDFLVAGASVMLYNLPEQMGIQEGNAGGIKTSGSPAKVVSVATNALSVPGAYSNTAAGYLDGNYGCWKDVIVFPNNDGRSTNATTSANASKPYFIVICGVAKAGHIYAGGAAANAGDLVFWYGQVNEVFTPNIIREVNVILKTGGSPTPPPGVVEYGKLEIIVGAPQPWGSIVITDPIEM